LPFALLAILASARPCARAEDRPADLVELDPVEKPGVAFLDEARRPGAAEGASREFLGCRRAGEAGPEGMRGLMDRIVTWFLAAR
jgi:hypothetical protein